MPLRPEIVALALAVAAGINYLSAILFSLYHQTLVFFVTLALATLLMIAACVVIELRIIRKK